MSARLQDINAGRLSHAVFFSPALGNLLQNEAETVAALYRARVAKRTGRLAESATATVTVGGHKKDRLVGKVVVGTGLEYGVLHEHGAPSNPNRQAAKDLAEIMRTRTKGT